MIRRERRNIDPNSAINLAIVRGILAVAILQTIGDFILEAISRPARNWTENVIIATVSGLIGYLSRSPSPGSGGVGPVAPNADNVTVNNNQAPEEGAQSGNRLQQDPVQASEVV